MKFTKEIVRPGKYVVNVPKKQADGSVKMVRQEQNITKERIAKWEANFLKMREKGLLVPAPFYHDLSALPISEAERTALDAAQRTEENRTKNNAGYWEHMFRDSNGSLHGIIDVEVPEYQERMGKSFKECSLLALPKYVSGEGDEYEDSIVHAAVVTNPVIPAQDNFKPIESTEDALAVAMSMSVVEEPIVPDVKPSVALAKEDGTALSLGDLTAVLPQLGITLPQDTNEQNFLDRLLTAATALVASKKVGTSVGTDNGLTIIPGGVAMSVTIDPNTPQGKMVAKQQREKLTSRIEALVTSGRVSAPYVKEVLLPQVEGCALSLSLDDDGNLGPTGLDPVLIALERLPANITANGKNVPNGKDAFKVGPLALSIGEDSDEQNIVTAEQAESVQAQIFRNVGYRSTAPANAAE